MKWFKHYSSARGDERISSLEDKSGLEGYGFYFKILEVIAEVMNESDNCSVTYSMTRWGRQLNITTKKFLTLAQRCSDVGLITLQQSGDNFTIAAPNLLKYRDNHTKNLQATCKQETSNLPLEKEKEKEKEKEDMPTTRVSSLRKLLDRGVDEEIARDWLVIRKAKKLPLTDTAIKQVEAESKIAGLTFGESVAVAVRNGWAGYKASWEDKSSIAPTMLVCPNGFPFSEWMKSSEQEKSEIMARYGK